LDSDFAAFWYNTLPLVLLDSMTVDVSSNFNAYCQCFAHNFTAILTIMNCYIYVCELNDSVLMVLRRGEYKPTLPETLVHLNTECTRDEN